MAIRLNCGSRLAICRKKKNNVNGEQMAIRLNCGSRLAICRKKKNNVNGEQMAICKKLMLLV